MRDIALFLFQFFGLVLKTVAGAAAIAFPVLAVSALLSLTIP